MVPFLTVVHVLLLDNVVCVFRIFVLLKFQGVFKMVSDFTCDQTGLLLFYKQHRYFNLHVSLFDIIS